MTADLLTRQLEGIVAAHQRLTRTLAALTDAELRAPSVLPDWSRAHVLAHIARNGDAVVRMLEGTLRDEVVAQYAGGAEGRAAEIEAGAAQSRDALISDVRESCARVDDVLTRMVPEAWGREARSLRGTITGRDVVRSRWREVEIHHVDLGLDSYAPADWPADFVVVNLADQLDLLSSRLPDDVTVHCGGRSYGHGKNVVEVDGPDHALLAWLVGRPQLAHGLIGVLPDLAPWS